MATLTTTSTIAVPTFTPTPIPAPGCSSTYNASLPTPTSELGFSCVPSAQDLQDFDLRNNIFSSIFFLYLGFSILSIAISVVFRTRAHIPTQSIILNILLVVGGILANYANLMLPTFEEISCLAKMWILFLAWPLIYASYVIRMVIIIMSLRSTARMARKPSRQHLTGGSPGTPRASAETEASNPRPDTSDSWVKQAAAVLGPLGLCHLVLPIIITVSSGELRDVGAPYCRETDMMSILLIVLHAFYILFLFPACLFFLRRYGGRRNTIFTEVVLVAVSMFICALLPIILRKASTRPARTATMLIPSSSWTALSLYLMLLMTVIIPLFQAIFTPSASAQQNPPYKSALKNSSTRSADTASVKLSIRTVTDQKDKDPDMPHTPHVPLSSTPESMSPSMGSSHTLVDSELTRAVVEIDDVAPLPPVPTVRSKRTDSAPASVDTISLNETSVSGVGSSTADRGGDVRRIGSFMPGNGNRSRTGGIGQPEIRTAHFEGLLKNKKMMEQFKVFASKQRCAENVLFYEELCTLDAIPLSSIPAIERRTLHLIDKYVRTDAEFELNIPYPVRRRVLEKVAALERNGLPVDPSVLDSVKREVVKMLYTDVWPRFVGNRGVRRIVDDVGEGGGGRGSAWGWLGLGKKAEVEEVCLGPVGGGVGGGEETRRKLSQSSHK
ncbi:hypothetical protein HDV00_002224 [Rhizophlyctis rosea]|nr:hypothetical protein HDV00_002224 [Rhizophlyctis rosea]